MLRILVLAIQGLVVAFLGYELVVSLWGWRSDGPPPPTSRRRRFRVVIPAHNEALVLPGILGDLAGQDYDHSLVRTAVVADRCSDDSAAVARRYAEVRERSDGEPGKGPALDWYLAQDPLDEEALVVFDADSRIPGDTLGRLADELETGDACQLYLDVENPDGSVLATASALSYWAGNRMVQLARHNLGWSADLGGTGMAFGPAVLSEILPFGAVVTDDQGALARLVIAGHRVRWIHDVRLRDEKPTGAAVAVRQRARWVAGKRAVARRHIGQLLAAAWRQRSWVPVDVAIRLVQPGRTFLALVSGVLAIVAAVTGSDLILWWWLWAAVAAIVIVTPVLFLVREGVPRRYVIRYPFLVVLAGLWLPARLASRLLPAGWRRTPRQAERT